MTTLQYHGVMHSGQKIQIRAKIWAQWCMEFKKQKFNTGPYWSQITGLMVL